MGERCNIRVKAAAAEVDNTSAFETSVASRLLTEHLHRISEPDLFRVRLVQPQQVPDYRPGSPTFVSEIISWGGAYCTRPADIIFADDLPIWLLGAMAVDGEIFLVHDTMNFVGQ